MAAASAAIVWNSRAVRARYTRGVLSATCGAVKSGTVMSRISLSSVPPPPASSTVMRSSIFPGGASNTSRCGAVAPARPESGRTPRRCRWAPRAPPRMPARHRASGRGRRDRPAAVAASSDTRPGCSRRTPVRLRQRLPDERHARLAVLAALGPDPRPHVLAGLDRRGNRGQRRLHRLGDVRRGIPDRSRRRRRSAPSIPCAPGRPRHAASPAP